MIAVANGRPTDDDIALALGDSIATALGLIAGCDRTLVDAIAVYHRTVDLVAAEMDAATAQVGLAPCGCPRDQARIGRHWPRCPNHPRSPAAGHALAAIFRTD
jgi:hypothetical protein